MKALLKYSVRIDSKLTFLMQQASASDSVDRKINGEVFNSYLATDHVLMHKFRLGQQTSFSSELNQQFNSTPCWTLIFLFEGSIIDVRILLCCQ